MTRQRRIALLTSGGDAPGMNAAVRAVVRRAEAGGATVVAVKDGFQGLVDGGTSLWALTSTDVAGIIQRGGTVIGTARSQAFLTSQGRRQAVKHLCEQQVTDLMVIGGDGSLTGASLLRGEWESHRTALIAAGELSLDTPESLGVVGIVGSIDNDFVGTETTIGADTALHRIIAAIDAIHSTAASHQRSFVVEVMGRNCGYLALSAALATGAQWVVVPEDPPAAARWRDELGASVRASRDAGRRHNLVIVAEGARDQDGNPITSTAVRDVMLHEFGEDTRITTLGHVQRGGAPSAFDRTFATLCGVAAVDALETRSADDAPVVVGLRHNEIVTFALDEAVAQTQSVATHLKDGDSGQVLALRGGNVAATLTLSRHISAPAPVMSAHGPDTKRFVVLHAGGPAPGMNAAVRAGVRALQHAGHQVLAAVDGFDGFAAGHFTALDWLSVSGFVSQGGAVFGTSRTRLDDTAVAQIATICQQEQIAGVLAIGGHHAYQACDTLRAAATQYPALAIPYVCVPATINNDLPATEQTIGSDTALNTIVWAIDKLKQSAVAIRRCYVVEVMGAECGYLAVAAALASGAEQVYTPEGGITLATLTADAHAMRDAFAGGNRLSVVIRSEHAHPTYTTPFLVALYEQEGGDLFDVRQVVLGNLQQGGDPSPFDRILAARLAYAAGTYLSEHAGRLEASVLFGVIGGRVATTPLDAYASLLDPVARRQADGRIVARLKATHDVLLADVYRR